MVHQALLAGEARRDLAVEHGRGRHVAQGHAAARLRRVVGLRAVHQIDIVQRDLARPPARSGRRGPRRTRPRAAPGSGCSSGRHWCCAPGAVCPGVSRAARSGSHFPASRHRPRSTPCRWRAGATASIRRPGARASCARSAPAWRRSWSSRARYPGRSPAPPCPGFPAPAPNSGRRDRGPGDWGSNRDIPGGGRPAARDARECPPGPVPATGNRALRSRPRGIFPVLRRSTWFPLANPDCYTVRLPKDSRATP